jgi:hypothetical protein
MIANTPAVDCMIGFPSPDAHRKYHYLREQTKDAESKTMDFPAEYMFKDVPKLADERADPVEITLGEMDRWGVGIGLVGLGSEATARALNRPWAWSG